MEAPHFAPKTLIWTGALIIVTVFAHAEPDPGGREASAARVLELLGEREPFWPRNPSVTPPPPAGGAGSQALIHQLAQSPDPVMRRRALEAWSLEEGPDRIPVALHALADPDAEVRKLAVRILEGHPADALVEFILETLTRGDAGLAGALHGVLPELRALLETPMLAIFEAEDESGFNRRAAAYCLGRMGSTAAVPLLIDGVRSGDANLAYTCAEALYAVQALEAIPAWIGFLTHELAVVRRRAVQALGILGGTAAYDALVRVASGQVSNEYAMKADAVAALAGWPLPEAAPALIEAMQREPSVRRIAADRLRNKTGLPLGDQPGEWAAWYAAMQAGGAPAAE